MKKKIVISATNLVEGGGLSILKQCIESFSSIKLDRNIFFIFIVHSSFKHNKFANSNIRFIYFDYPKKNWLYKIFFEYIHLYFISLTLRPFAWLSLHDISPNVNSVKRYVYCHNPSIFYDSTYFDFKFDKKFFLFTKFYKYLYKINIKKNNLIFVQQNWIKDSFIKLFQINNVRVVKPNINEISNKFDKKPFSYNDKKIKVFYPSFPRVYKNFHFLLSTISQFKLLEYDFFFTINGTENKYSKYLISNYKHLKNVNYIGQVTLDQCYNIYRNIDILVFPSKLETWGLPLSEAQFFNKKIVAPDLEYVRENCYDYPNLYTYKNDDCKSFLKALDNAKNSDILKKNNSKSKLEVNNWNIILNEMLK